MMSNFLKLVFSKISAYIILGMVVVWLRCLFSNDLISHFAHIPYEPLQVEPTAEL